MAVFRILLPLVMLLIVCPVLLCSDDSSASSGNILITEVSPADEAVCIENISLSSVNLKGYSVTDGEGTLTFTSSYQLGAGSKVVVSKESGTDWFNSRAYVMTFSSSYITKSGSFTLANSGDEVSLSDGTAVIDSVCYGGSSGVEGWTGDPATVSSGQYLLRNGPADTGTCSDWISTKPGWTNYTFSDDVRFPAEVIPFTFPESNGVPVLKALSEAEESVDISIYLLSSPKVVSVLCQKAEDGVTVRVLMEGDPLGVDISTEISLMNALVVSGGEVRIIDYSGSSDTRYSYVHNKYAVIDGSTVVITSENWTAGNIGGSGNRGWGAVIESCGYAAYMESVFENDYSSEWGDVSDLLTVYPNCKLYTGLSVVSYDFPDYPSFSAYVSPVLSPDNSLSALESIISEAEVRVYAEQMDLGSDLSQTKGDTPISWMSQAASRGVDARLILDSSQTDGSTHETYINAITNATSIKAVAVNGGDGFTLIHNKGLVVDDSVWLGSVNWTDTSFQRNRESAVLIDSAEVSGYFAGFFLEDFGTNLYTVEETGLELSVSLLDTPEGLMALLEVSGPSGYDYQWSLGDGQTRISSDNAALFLAPSDGVYDAGVVMLGTGLEDSVEYSVEGQGDAEYDDVIAYASASAAAVLILGIVVSVIRERSGDTVVSRKSPRAGGHYRR